MEKANISRLSEIFGMKIIEGKPVASIGKEKFISKVELPVNADAFIVHTPEAVEVASKPEIVGRELDSLIVEPARLTSTFLRRYLEPDNPITFLHILRGSQGYRLNMVLHDAGFDIKEQFVRVVYSGEGEKHSDSTPHVARAQLSELSGKEKTLIVADTVATGRTLIEALRIFFEFAQFKGAEFKRVLVYGFISEIGAGRISDFLEKRDIELALVSIEDFSALSSNQYDMPLYGPDVTSKGVNVDRLIGGTTIPEAIEQMVKHYFPGSDQPGDWSERQCLLFNGSGYERGRIDRHLDNSLNALEDLYSASREAEWFESWMERIYMERKKGIVKAKSKDHCAPD